MLLLEKFYTAGKNFYTATNSVNELNLNSFFLNNELKFFTLPPTVPVVTNLTSAAVLCRFLVLPRPREKTFPVHPCISPSLIFPPKQRECQSHLLAGQVRALVTG